MQSKLPITKAKKQALRRSERGDFFMPGRLTLADGTVWQGVMPEWQTGEFYGEVVFNTGMTGYVESLTDPSYAGQILVFTYPLIGNYGVRAAASESGKVQASGVVVAEAAAHWSHAGSQQSLADWLQAAGVPLLSGVDTRALTKHLRIGGTTAGVISDQPVKDVAAISTALDKKFVSIEKPVTYKPGLGTGKTPGAPAGRATAATKTVILVDCGAKQNILRSLLGLGVRVKRVPRDYDYTSENYDGVLLSNGPGDPTDYAATVKIAKKAMAGSKPIFGICLGTQIMALAAGATTYKLKFGHRGHNQPCLETALWGRLSPDSHTARAYITSQNHGYAIEERSLPKDWRVTFRNLNDDSVEGIAHKTKPFFSVQFHPEACPGPTDTAWLFERFYAAL